MFATAQSQSVKETHSRVKLSANCKIVKNGLTEQTATTVVPLQLRANRSVYIICVKPVRKRRLAVTQFDEKLLLKATHGPPRDQLTHPLDHFAKRIRTEFDSQTAAEKPQVRKI